MTREEELYYIEKAQKGDLDAYAILARAYKDMIFTLSLRILKQREDAEDHTQDVLIKIFKNISKYRKGMPFAAWVYKVCYNACINRYRSDKRRKSRLSVNEHIHEDWAQVNNALKEMETEETRYIVLNAIDRLSRTERLIVMSYYYESFSVSEIAEITGLTESNIKVKLFRARKTLYKLLEKTSVREKLL